MKVKRTTSIGRVENNAAYEPIDRMSASMLGKSDDGLQERNHNNTFKTPPLLRPVPAHYRFNLVGKKVGQLLVVGLLAARRTNNQQKKRASARWVVKCSCGNYEILLTKTVRRGKYLMCDECLYSHELSERITNAVEK